MQRGGQAARTGRRVISQKWGFFGKGPLDVSVLVGWRGVGMGWVGRCSTAGTYPVRTSARPFHPFHCYPLATVLPPPPLCRSVTVQCPEAGPKVQPSSRLKRAHPEVKLLGASPL